MENTFTNPILKKVGDIKGDFFIPSYQRGYRWTKKEVLRLLEDIHEFGANKKENENYCLQPVILKKKNDGKYELIDGQQRLTTIFLIYVYMHKSSNGFLPKPKFSLSYETRPDSDFLKDPKEEGKTDNIDFYFIWQAYQDILSWFKNKGDKKQSVLTNINKYFDESINVIWYEIPENENPIDLFTRFNIGKIALTNSELVKALFLTDSSTKPVLQNEISLQWDNMEKELRDSSFWYFLTNKDQTSYPTHIDFLLDMIANKSEDDRENYRTFFYFKDNKDDTSIWEKWQKIRQSYLTLREWFYDHELYHKIGYLVAVGSVSLSDLLKKYSEGSKQSFRNSLDEQIKKSLKLNESQLDGLFYDTDYKKITELLLLFNVESVRNIDTRKQRFPFDRYKKEFWSLEHIHAQHSIGLNTNEKRKLWLKDHLEPLKRLSNLENNSNIGSEDVGNLIDRVKTLIDRVEANSKQEIGTDFDLIQKDVVRYLSPQNDNSGEYIDSLSNMALLSQSKNSSLSNYTFDAKRDKIIAMDKKGEYIPFCTKMVFLKYYSESDTNLHFWGENDRKSYIENIKETLKDFLNNEEN